MNRKGVAAPYLAEAVSYPVKGYDRRIVERERERERYRDSGKGEPTPKLDR